MDKAMHSEFEGHTPGPWEILYPQGIDMDIISQEGKICSLSGYSHSVDLMNENEAKERANAKLITAAPDLLKENQSLRSELQKLKELNAELVEGLSKLAQRTNITNMINEQDKQRIEEEFTPQWYSQQEEEHYLLRENYSPYIAKELSQRYADRFQGAFAKGYEKGSKRSEKLLQEYREIIRGLIPIAQDSAINYIQRTKKQHEETIQKAKSLTDE